MLPVIQLLQNCSTATPAPDERSQHGLQERIISLLRQILGLDCSDLALSLDTEAGKERCKRGATKKR